MFASNGTTKTTSTSSACVGFWIRVPHQWWGDYSALLGAARIGERRLLELGDELGWDTLSGFSDEWLGYSEQRMKAAIQALPSGEATITSVHDPVPVAPDGIPVKVTVRVRGQEAMIDVDLRDNLDCLPCGMNLTECTSTAAAMIGIFNSVADDVPPNGGSARRINVMLRDNCIVGDPKNTRRAAPSRRPTCSTGSSMRSSAR